MSIATFTPTTPPAITGHEIDRLKNIEEYGILDSLPEREYNEITKLASYICNTPMSQLNIVYDKLQFTKSNFGIPGVYTPREQSVCTVAMNTPEEIFIVPDLRDDERFYDKPAVSGELGLVFYAGVPLVSPDGFALGTLCVLDNKPRQLNEVQIDTLKALANQVISLLELRRNKMLLEKAKAELEEKNRELEKFAYVVAHDLKSPLNNISGMARRLTKKYAGSQSPEINEMLQMMAGSADRLKTLVDGILEHSRCESHIAQNNTQLDVEQLMHDTVNFFSYYKDCTFIVPPVKAVITANKTAISQVLINLISNAIKYNDKKEAIIELIYTETDLNYSFAIKDNGPGIEKKNQEDIFGIFKVFADSDRYGNRGTGIGLATVKKLVTKLKGSISLDSDLGMGSVFTVVLPR